MEEEEEDTKRRHWQEEEDTKRRHWQEAAAIVGFVVQQCHVEGNLEERLFVAVEQTLQAARLADDAICMRSIGHRGSFVLYCKHSCLEREGRQEREGSWRSLMSVQPTRAELQHLQDVIRWLNLDPAKFSLQLVTCLDSGYFPRLSGFCF
jgi:hypothetical protein